MDTRADSQVISESLRTPGAFGVIFDRHSRAVYRYARRRIGEETAADLTSEVFTRAFGDRARFDRSSASALPWLLGIATNLIRMHHRTEERRLRAYGRAGSRTDTGGDGQEIDDRLEAEAARGVLADAVALLPSRQRDVLLLSAYGELTPAEIALALAIPAGSVRSELHRARSFVASQLAARAPHLVPDQEPIP